MVLHKRRGINNMIQSQLFTRILRKSTPALIATVVAIGLLAGASHGLAVTMTWTNGTANWTSATAWTTNQASGTDPVGLTNVTCIAGSVTNVTATCVGGNGVPGINDEARFTNDTSYTVTLSINTNLSVVTVSNTTGVVTINASGATLTVTNRFRVSDDNTTSTVVWVGRHSHRRDRWSASAANWHFWLQCCWHFDRDQWNSDRWRVSFAGRKPWIGWQARRQWFRRFHECHRTNTGQQLELQIAVRRQPTDHHQWWQVFLA